MRLLFLNPVAVLGGAERVLLDWMASLRAAAPSAELGLVAFSEGPLLSEARALGVDARVVPLPEALLRLGDSGQRGRNRLSAAAHIALRGARAGTEGLRFLNALRGAVEDFRPSLLHSNGVKSHVLATAVKPRRVPLVWHIHDFLGERPLASGLLKPCALRADLAIANSRAVAEDTRALFPRVPTHVVYNGVDVERFAPGGPTAPLDALAGLPPAPEGCLRVGLVATYARWKGQDIFLEAAARVRAERPGVPLRFYVVGGPLYETPASQFSAEELRSLAERHGLNGHVGFVPFQARPEEVFRALDVVVHASTRPEPFGRTIVEGMACAKPVLVSRAGGAAELFTEGHDALGVEPSNAEALARALLTLVDAPERREALGAEGRRSAVRRFSRERLGHEALPLYESVLGTKR
ncbi:glycosyltransferase family 4 protein [Myxococcaceae bacterium GXIMD 01537]